MKLVELFSKLWPWIEFFNGVLVRQLRFNWSEDIEGLDEMSLVAVSFFSGVFGGIFLGRTDSPSDGPCWMILEDKEFFN